MIGFTQFLWIIGTALSAAVLVGIIAAIALRVAARSSLLARIVIVVAAAVLSTIAAAIAIAHQMYISQHDLAVLCWIIGIGGAVSLGIAVLLGRQISLSSERLRQSAREIAAGRVITVDAREGGEFARVSAELATTSERLADARNEVAMLDASRRQLVAWISHDLRTPLAALRAMAESLEDGMADDPSRYHRQMRGQADILTAMVDDLFELSKIQSGTLKLSMEPVSLFDLVSDTVADLHPIAAARSVTLIERSTGDLTLWGDARELSRVIGNLLMNAIQHSSPGSEIVISAHETDGERVALSVTDEGGGIPEDDLVKIFEAGWRGTQARTPDTVLGPSAGAGLGLAIVHGIVEAHSGGVSVQNVPGGCRFDVILPRLAAVSVA